MKKLILVVAAALMTTGAFAQNFDWGVKAGLNLAEITKTDDGKMKPSVYVGAFAEFYINDFLSIQPELVYSRQGNYYKEGDDKQWNKLNYLNLPIVAKIYVLDNLSVDLGPQFGYMLNAKYKIKMDGETIKGDIEGTKDFDVSFAMGLSYKICEKMDVSARYNLGLTKVGEEGDGKNGVIQVGVGYRF